VVQTVACYGREDCESADREQIALSVHALYENEQGVKWAGKKH